MIVIMGQSLLARPTEGPIRVLFLGHDNPKHHVSDKYYPMVVEALGRDAIYFDYTTSVEEALGNANYLDYFDVVLLYANHKNIKAHQWRNLNDFIDDGGGFVPLHCASWCFSNESGFDQLVGGRFETHKSGVFTPITILPDHPAIAGVPALTAWDETYVHKNHNHDNRTVLQVREVTQDDNITKPEPWTWVRTQGKGRIFYTASGHDQRVWSQDAFHALLKQGILWSAGDDRSGSYQQFIKARTPLTYKKVDNIPNYEKRPEPLPKQDPLSPEDSLHHTQIRADFDLALFASEPDIVNPIFLAWDQRGRLWVAETVDYPNDVRDGSGNDTIKILEDTDGDGKCDKVTLFAEGLNIPTSLTFWDGGIIVAQAPDFLYLKDEDGDDKADIKKVLFTGWGTRDTHAGPSNLRYGLDNWIYGSVGYSGFNGEVGGKRLKFGQGVYRFKPDGSALEFLYQFNNNTWGLGLNSAGDVFGSTANRNPAFFGAFAATGYPAGKGGKSAEMIADRIAFAPITPNIRQVDAFGQYTAGAGYVFATSDNFPSTWRGKMAFISGPTGNLLGMYENRPKADGYEAINRFNLIASSDEWFSPVAAEVGPDGNLWVSDWYNFIIQHNPTPNPKRGGYQAKRGKGNAHENPHRDKQHGRIYRAIWKDAKPSKITSLHDATDESLITALKSDNQFWRLTAQRIIVAQQRTQVAGKLKALLAHGGAVGSHALWTLKGLRLLDKESHQKALLNSDDVLKRNAIRAIDHTDDGMQLFFDSAVVQAKAPLVKLAAFTKLAHFPDRKSVQQVATQLMQDDVNSKHQWLKIALTACGASATSGKVVFTGPNLLPNPSFEKVDAKGVVNGWRPHTYKGTAQFAVDTAVALSGKNSIRISSKKGADCAYQTTIDVEPNTEYMLSGWVKIKGRLQGAMGALMNVHGIEKTNAFSRTQDKWQKVEVVFNTKAQTQVTINALFGGWGESKGTAWWDDVSLVKGIVQTTEENKTEPGDMQRGKKIFNEHQLASCIRCHAIAGKGGVVGPPLDGIATRKDSDYILKALLEPNAEMADGYKLEMSPMPPMGVLLNKQELVDIMAYMNSLK